MALPSGLDWTLHCFEHINYLSYLADHFHEPLAQWAEPRMAKMILLRQCLDGRYDGDSTPNGFYREAVEAAQVVGRSAEDPAHRKELARDELLGRGGVLA